ncbi:hypothetical protein TanjilG_21919 [Lupinus angustifolius]|uniref:Uncharacterized protein n=1 Tax=Lupinus angustifolius TaxID=3871 RepID=A0A1J7HUI8_LUPAN|nr:hypothetical protein TanjilG_21919 [Lupinus angustifolius]
MEHKTNMKKQSEETRYVAMGHAVHSQVIKIKQEIAKIKEPSLKLHMSHAFLRDGSNLHSRSPLGLGGERVILVGNS